MAMSEFTDVPTESRAAEQILQPALTLEIALYIAFALGALWLRLFALGDAPLATDEARQALASWNFAHGIAEPFTGSPLLFTGNAIVFALFGATDGLARLFPAVFGSVLVLLPALVRRELGRLGALIASALLVLSPSLVFASRDANGAMIAVTCALATWAFAWRYLNDHAQRDLNLAAIALALALVSAREVWTIILAVAIVVVWARVVGGRATNLPAIQLRNTATILFLVVFFGVATLFAMHREGIGATFDLLGAWFDGLRPDFTLGDLLRLLVIYEPIPLFFGTAALVQFAFTARDLEPRVRGWLGGLMTWIGVAFVLYSLGADKNPVRVVVIVVPLILVAGKQIGAWLERAAQETDRVILGTNEAPVYFLALALAGFLYFVIAEFVMRGDVVAAQILATATGLSRNGANWDGAIVVGLMCVAVAAIVFLAVTTVGLIRAKNIGVAIILTLFALWTIRQNAMLNFFAGGALNPYEPLVAHAAAVNVRDLAHDLEDISRWRANDSHTLAISADETLGSMLAWNLREFRNAHLVAHPTATAETQVLVLAANATAPASNWMSQVYHLESTYASDAENNWLRWLLFRDVGAAQYRDAVLWMPQPQ